MKCGEETPIEGKFCHACGAALSESKAVVLGTNDEGGQTAQHEITSTPVEPSRRVDDGLINCPDCGEAVSPHARSCPSCGSELPVEKSNFMAGCLGFLLGPVGLWYKGHWAAGFAWLVVAVIASIATGGVAAPFFWVGMGIHALVAKPRR